MITYARFVGILEPEVGPGLFDRLVAIYPEGRDCHVFKCRLPTDDTRVSKLMETLAAAGRKPWTDQSRRRDKQQEYWLYLEREYESSDLLESDLLELMPPYLFERDIDGAYGREHGDAWREEGGVPAPKGELQMLTSFLRKDIDIAWTKRGYVVPNRVKVLIESARLAHVVFKPTGLQREYGEHVEWKSPNQRWWELTSDLTLPPLSPSMDLRDRDYRPIKRGNISNGCYRYEGLHVHPELHYRAADLTSAEPFDLARTFESFGGNPLPDEHVLVASKRFYGFCRQHELRTDWVPVRIDPE